MKDLTLETNNENLYTVIDEIKDCLKKNNCPEDVITEISIAAEEIFVNIVNYAYGGDEGLANVEIDVSPNPKVCRLVFKDSGVPYNPLEKEDPDIELGVEERKVGGLGIFMAKEIMDKMTYEYKDGKNVLTIEKNV